MSDNQNLDVGKVISVLMENPSLIAEISNLVKKEEPSEPTEKTPAATEVKQEISTPASVSIPSAKSNRTQLLGALKPYLSEPRAKAIDSMMTIADIIDMMKAR